MAKNIEEKLAIENSRQPGCIVLFLEGGFFRAYEHSALDALKNLHEFKVTCRFFKAVQSRVAYIGFPVASLAKFANGHVIEQHEDIATIKLSDGSVVTTDEEFTAWKDALPTTEDNNGPIPSQKKRSEIYQKIINYPLENRTPLQCMIFLAEIRTELISNNNGSVQ